MRYRDWEVRLSDFIDKNLDTPFEWGRFDCCLSVADAVRAFTGQDFAEAFRGHYSTPPGAVRALRRYGSGSLKATLNEMFGPFKPRLNAGRGDVVLIETEQGDALGIVFGGQIWAASDSGLKPLPMNRAVCCWSVPCL